MYDASSLHRNAAAAAMSSLVVAIAPSLPAILVARFLLGAAISGFWSMSITVAARLSSPDRIGRAMMFGSAGVSLATVAGVPIGVALSEALDWRLAFLLIAAVTAAVGVAVRLALPPVPPAAGVPPVFDPLVPVVPVDPVEPHEAVLPYEDTPTVDTPAVDSPAVDSSEGESGETPPSRDGR